MEEKKISILFSSNGEVYYDIKTGKVTEIQEEGPEFYISDIDIIDIGEWEKYYHANIPIEGLDILDVGYWLKNGEYVSPDQIWRDEINV